jgi:hypothetical protein
VQFERRTEASAQARLLRPDNSWTRSLPGLQLADPDVAESHRIPVILQRQRQLLRRSFVRRPFPVRCWPRKLNVILPTSTPLSILVTCLLPHNEREPVRVISLNAEARGRLHLARLLASCSCPGCWAYVVKAVESLCLCCAMQRSQNCKTPTTLLRSSADGPCSCKATARSRSNASAQPEGERAYHPTSGVRESERR